jgi:hypothetical protein
MNGRELRAFNSRLQTVWPTLHPTKVSLTKQLGPALSKEGKLGLGACWGDTGVRKVKGQEVLLIRINVYMTCPIARFMVFVHEYAHAMSWRPEHQLESDVFDHAPEWGLCEARLWVWVSDELNDGAPVRGF